jgi:hypothetical protein
LLNALRDILLMRAHCCAKRATGVHERIARLIWAGKGDTRHLEALAIVPGDLLVSVEFYILAVAFVPFAGEVRNALIRSGDGDFTAAVDVLQNVVDLTDL